jgi:hypothetical protein
MNHTPRRLNRATLGRQLLLRREPLEVRDGVHRVVALQAQEAASPYLALWNRLAPFDAADLDAAFADRTVVKAPLMRITLHAVHAGDYPVFHHAMLPALRAARLRDRTFTDSGLSVAEADALVPHLVEFAAQPRTGAEMEDLIRTRLAGHRPGVWWALRAYAPLTHAPTGGPWSFGPRPSFHAAGTSLPPEQRAGSMQRLVRRYLEAFGPASVADIARFTLYARSTVREALTALADGVEELKGPDGVQLFDVPGGLLPDEDSPAPPRLLPMWDSILLAYDDRSRVIPPEYLRVVIRHNGDVLPSLLVDGYVAGVWRPVEEGIEVSAFRRLPEETWGALESEVRALLALLCPRDPLVYRRYARWWTALSSADVRVLS